MSYLLEVKLLGKTVFRREWPLVSTVSSLAFRELIAEELMPSSDAKTARVHRDIPPTLRILVSRNYDTYHNL